MRIQANEIRHTNTQKQTAHKLYLNLNGKEMFIKYMKNGFYGLLMRE